MPRGAARRLQQFSPPIKIEAGRVGSGTVWLSDVASRSPPPPEATLTMSPPSPLPPLQIGKTAASSGSVPPEFVTDPDVRYPVGYTCSTSEVSGNSEGIWPPSKNMYMAGIMQLNEQL